jgi:GDP-L-fucose synthase
LVSKIGYDGEILFNSKYPDGNPRKLLDSSKIKTFGWNPKTNLKEGLGLTYNWYKKNLQI